MTGFIRSFIFNVRICCNLPFTKRIDNMWSHKIFFYVIFSTQTGVTASFFFWKTNRTKNLINKKLIFSFYRDGSSKVERAHLVENCSLPIWEKDAKSKEVVQQKNWEIFAGDVKIGQSVRKYEDFEEL